MICEREVWNNTRVSIGLYRGDCFRIIVNIKRKRRIDVTAEHNRIWNKSTLDYNLNGSEPVCRCDKCVCKEVMRRLA